MTRLPARLLLLPILLLLAGACSSAGATPIPTGPPSPSPSQSSPVALPVTTPDAAAQLVIASDARFAGIGKKDPNLIGACCFYEATAGGDGSFAVTIEIGWGDCPAGCTDRHRWFYTVAADGTLVLVREEGSPVPDGVGGGGSGGDGVGGGILPGGPGIAGQALAGPTCPVVRPGDPSCNSRPVAGATILIRDATGTVVAQMTTDADGRFQVKVPPGDYRIEPQPVEGLIGGAEPIDVTVGADFKVVQLSYDTGIR
jgi:Carboxypeptidase regulatory-like domain